jgi:hypothetical protein
VSDDDYWLVAAFIFAQALDFCQSGWHRYYQEHPKIYRVWQFCIPKAEARKELRSLFVVALSRKISPIHAILTSIQPASPNNPLWLLPMWLLAAMALGICE